MSTPITFYYNPMSRGRIVHWMLEEVGADYRIQLIDWKKNEQKSPEYLRINPMGKVPAIVHGSTVVTETAAICAYLADIFPEKALAPAVHSPERGTYYRWLFFSVGCVEPALTDKDFPRTGSPGSGRLSYGSYEDTVNTLEQAVSGGYLVGGRFTAADLYVSSQIGWALMQKQIEPRPAFLKYHELCVQRPAFRRFTDKADALGG